MLVQEKDFVRREQLERSLGHTEARFTGKAKSGAFRLAEHRQRMATANISGRVPAMGNIVRDHVADKPMTTDALYRLLSAFGHGEGVASMASSHGEPFETRLPRSKAAKVSSHDPMARDITDLAVRCFALGVTELDHYAAGNHA
jgi:hypothetical protein